MESVLDGVTEPVSIPFLPDACVELIDDDCRARHVPVLSEQRAREVLDETPRRTRRVQMVHLGLRDRLTLRLLGMYADALRWWTKIRRRAQPIDVCIVATLAMILVVLVWSSYEPVPAPAPLRPGEISIEAGYSLG